MVEKAKSWLQFAGVVAGILSAVYVSVSGVWAQVVKRDDLVTHDVSASAHSPIRDAVDRCEAKAGAALGRLDELRADQVAIGARMIRLVSADIERDGALRAARASFYEEQYRGLVLRGLPVEEAMLEALRTPWYSRPRR